MRIKTIRLSHFRRFTDLTINLGSSPRKIIALVGPNGCGKSSVFDGFLEKLRNYYDSGGATPEYLSKSKYYESGGSDDYNRNDAVTITREDDSQNFSTKSFYVRTPYRFSGNISVNQIQKLPDVFTEQRPGYTAQVDNRLNQNYQRLHGQLIHEYQNGDKTGREFRVELIDKINTILKSVLEVKISDLGDIIGGKGQLFFDKGISKNFRYENLSAGEKEVVDLIIDLVIKTKDYSETIFCIDEPELHLNTSIQRKLLIEIEKLIPDNCQLWIATHSIGFLRALQEELKDKTSILNFSDKDFDVAQIIEPVIPTRNQWQEIFKTALEDITGLVAPKQIIYCEGRKEPSSTGDEQGLDAQVYNQIFEQEFPDTLFVSSGGNTEPDKYSEIALSVLSKAFLDVEILLLKDKDIKDDGSDTTDNDRTDWLNGSPMRRMLNRKEIENYLFDFSIINKAYPQITKEQYNAIQISNNDYKAKSAEFLNLCGLNNTSLKDFKILLAHHIIKGDSVYNGLKECIFH